MGALGGRDGGGAGRPVHGRQFPGGGHAEVHPHSPAVRPGRPGGPASNVVGRDDAQQRHGHPAAAIQAGVLCQEQQRQDGRVDGVSEGLAMPMQGSPSPEQFSVGHIYYLLYGLDRPNFAVGCQLCPWTDIVVFVYVLL